MDGLYTKNKSKVRNRRFYQAESADNLLTKKRRVWLSLLDISWCASSQTLPWEKLQEIESRNQVFCDLAVFGYLGSCSPQCRNGFIPYMVWHPSGSLSMQLSSGLFVPMSLLPMSWVLWMPAGLVSARSWMTPEDMQIGRPACPDSNLQCLGFGICREINMDKRLYHILMPVPLEELRNVNCLLAVAICILECVTKSQRELQGTKPYVMTDYNLVFPRARETEEPHKEKLHPKSKFYRKSNWCIY